MHTGQLSADRLDQKCRDNRRVNAAGQRQQNLLVTDLLAQRGELLLDEGLGKFRGGDPLHAFRELFLDEGLGKFRGGDPLHVFRAFVFSHLLILRL